MFFYSHKPIANAWCSSAAPNDSSLRPAADREPEGEEPDDRPDVLENIALCTVTLIGTIITWAYHGHQQPYQNIRRHANWNYLQGISDHITEIVRKCIQSIIEWSQSLASRIQKVTRTRVFERTSFRFRQAALTLGGLVIAVLVIRRLKLLTRSSTRDIFKTTERVANGGLPPVNSETCARGGSNNRIHSFRHLAGEPTRETQRPRGQHRKGPPSAEAYEARTETGVQDLRTRGASVCGHHLAPGRDSCHALGRNSTWPSGRPAAA